MSNTASHRLACIDEMLVGARAGLSSAGVSSILIATWLVLTIHEPVFAQTPESRSAGSGGSGTLEEIVVTAEKRESTVQKTPISLTVMTGQDLLDRGISSLASAMTQVPGVSFSSSGPGQTVYAIRGLSANGGASSTVGFYLDEIVVSPPSVSTNGKVTIDPDLYDLARIEVLRGPQGTLYGAGAMGGTIKLVTNQPDTSRFAASGETMLSGTPGGGFNYRQNAMVNLPFAAEKAALRLVGTYAHTAGWIDRVVVNKFPLESTPDPNGAFYGLTRGNVLGSPPSKVYQNVNDETLSGARIALLVEPNERLSVTAGMIYQRIAQGGASLYDSVPSQLAFFQPFDVAEPYSDQFSLSSLTTKFDFGSVLLTLPTGYLKRRSSIFQDASEAAQNGLKFPAYSVADGGLGAVPVYEFDATQQFTQEARLTSNTRAPLQWIVGLYYSRYNFDFASAAISPQILALSGGLTDALFQGVDTLRITQKAAFGNIKYEFANNFQLTAGLRYFSYKGTNTNSTWGLLFTGSSVANTTAGKGSDSGINPMVNIAYTPVENAMFYVTAAKGFREGNGNLPVLTGGSLGAQCNANLNALGLTSAPATYGPDTVWSYELGEKVTLFDHRVTLNGDIYYLNWAKTQQPVSLACGFLFTANGANAGVKGVELEINAAITPKWHLIQNVGWSYAAYTNSSLETSTVAGQRLFDAPNWTISTTVEYRTPIGSGFEGVANVSNSFTSKSTDLTYYVNQLPSRDLINARFGVKKEQLSAALFVDNALDRRLDITNTTLYLFNIPTHNRVATNQPRTIGLDINYRF